jgi:addiction module HigA family antidote
LYSRLGDIGFDGLTAFLDYMNGNTPDFTRATALPRQERRGRPDRDCRLPLGGIMARTPIHPGEHLAEELKELSMSAAELVRQIDVPVNRVTGIFNGQRAITADTALRLGHWFQPGILAQSTKAL